MNTNNNSTKIAVAAAAQANMLAAISGSGPGVLVDPTNFFKTDAGNALLFVAMFGSELLYVEAWQTWMIWNGLKWVAASDGALIPLARGATEHMFNWSATLPDEERDKLRKHAMSSQKKERLLAMVTLAKGEPSVRVDPHVFDANPWLLGCEGATFNLRTKQVFSPRRNDYITKSIGIVLDKGAQCPNWLALLDWAFQGDKTTIDHVQRIAGYLLTGDVSEEKLFAFFGSGGNGKTTVVMTLFAMLGDYAWKGRSDLLLQSQGEKGAASPDVAALHGKRLVVVSETDENRAIAEAQVKAITSNEPIAARKLHRDPFTFMPTHKTLLMTNHRPFVKGTDDGIWRRFDIVAFNAQITDDENDRGPKKNPRFREEVLLPELPGILAWAVRGCFMWQRDGLKPSAPVKAATQSYREEMDYIAHWLEERTATDLQFTTTRSIAYADYRGWAQAEGAPILSRHSFVEDMRARGFVMRKSHGSWLLCGLRLRVGGGLHVVASVAANS